MAPLSSSQMFYRPAADNFTAVLGLKCHRCCTGSLATIGPRSWYPRWSHVCMGSRCCPWMAILESKRLSPFYTVSAMLLLQRWILWQVYRASADVAGARSNVDALGLPGSFGNRGERAGADSGFCLSISSRLSGSLSRKGGIDASGSFEHASRLHRPPFCLQRVFSERC